MLSSQTVVARSLNESLESLAREKSAQYQTVVVDEFPPFQGFSERLVIGDFSMTALQSKRRWLAQDVYIEPFGFPQSPTELARMYLTVKYKFPLMIRSENAVTVSKPRPSPLLARPSRIGYGVYLDIRHTYLQIIRAVGWDVEYWPGKYLAKKSDMKDMPPWLSKSKPAYCSFVSVCRPSNLAIWNGKELTNEYSFNKFLNMRLVALVSDVLNGVASEMKDKIPSLVYVNTDGYIVGDKDAHNAMDILHSWGLEYSVKGRGGVTVTGTGSYSVGRKRSLREGDGRGFDNIPDREYKWIKRNFAPFAMSDPSWD